MTVALILLGAFFGPGVCRAADTPPYLDPHQPLETRVEDLLSRLTLDEKISLLHANSKFTTAAIPRLGLPLRRLSDGPLGVRVVPGPGEPKTARLTGGCATAMPAGLCLASTWDPELAREEGKAIGEEARALHEDIMLGPAVNIMRTPLCGRNFEYFGEDPFLAGCLAAGYIRGEQSEDVASCVKHFVANNQELNRRQVSVEVSERALREIYLPAFKAAVREGGAWCVMGANNKVRGRYCCENDYLLNRVLKHEWGFRGLVVSDWAGTHSTRGAALGGLDLEMSMRTNYADYYLARPYLEALRNGELPKTGLDDKVQRNLRVMLATHVLDPGRKPGSLNTAAHQAVSRRVAEEGIVLLKNAGRLLPLDTAKITSIAVIGENAVRLQDHGGGSSQVRTLHEITPLQGILNRAGQRVNITFSQGYSPRGGQALVARAVTAARSADVVVYVGGLHHQHGFDSEDADRKDLQLPYGQEELIRHLVAANPRTIVVLEGSIVEMSSWVDKVPAVLQAWYLGMEGGDALAAVLFGDVNPSGKLPCTIPRRLADSPAHALGAYPGTNNIEVYREGLLVGYRWFDTRKIAPQFPFGFGLSYTTFKYSSLKLVSGGGTNGIRVTVQFRITNTGNRAGTEIAQVYIHQDHPRRFRPFKELKGFQRVFLEPGESRVMSIPLDRTAFAFYDPARAGWVAEKDTFRILVGASSRDIRLTGHFDLPRTIVFVRALSSH